MRDEANDGLKPEPSSGGAMKRRGLLEDANLDGVEIRNLTEEQRSKIIQEYSIELILSRVRSEPELRSRLRKQSETLKADTPGRKLTISDKDVYEIISLLTKSGVSMRDAVAQLSSDIGLKTSSTRTKYFRGKSLESK